MTKFVLSLDGGGIRGIIPAVVLVEIERQTGRGTAELFDLIAGTSTGGILGLCLSVPGNDGFPLYPATEAREIYRRYGREIFKRGMMHGVRSAFGFAGPKYPAAGLDRVLQLFLGDLRLSESLVKMLVPSYDLEARRPIFFKSWAPSTESVSMRDAALATSAAPTYFPPARVSINGERKALIDGGVYVNNPAVSAAAEARRLWPGEEIRVISIGTGELTRPIEYRSAINWGLVRWAAPVIDCMMDGSSDAASYQMYRVLGPQFVRIQKELTIASDNMDDASEENIDRLMQEGAALVDMSRETINSLCEDLTK